MSVVAVRITEDKIQIGSDSIRVSGHTQEKLELGKLREINGLIIGSSGVAYESSLLFLFAKTRKPAGSNEEDIIEYLSEFQDWVKKKTGGTNFSVDNYYIFVYEERVFRIHKFLVQEIKDYMAIGAGRDFALSALYLGATVEKAIETACELSIYCEKPIQIIEVERVRRDKEKEE